MKIQRVYIPQQSQSLLWHPTQCLVRHSQPITVEDLGGGGGEGGGGRGGRDPRVPLSVQLYVIATDGSWVSYETLLLLACCGTAASCSSPLRDTFSDDHWPFGCPQVDGCTSNLASSPDFPMFQRTWERWGDLVSTHVCDVSGSRLSKWVWATFRACCVAKDRWAWRGG